MPPTLLYDGHCGLCSGVVQTLLRIDRRGLFRFAPLQSAFAKTRLAAAGLDPAALDTVVLVEGDRVSVKSEAVLRIARLLGGPWRLLAVGWVLPKGARDAVYDWVARHRYRVFGRHEACWLPPRASAQANPLPPAAAAGDGSA